MPRPDCLVVVRYSSPAWSAAASCERRLSRNERITMFSPPIMTPWPAPPSSRPASLPDIAPPTIMPMPSSRSSSCWLCAVLRSVRRRGRMRAGDMAGLMRDDADDLVRRVRLHERFGVHEDVAAIHHERIEQVALDDAHVDVLRFQAGGPEDRPRIVLQQFLDLGVADQADRLGAGRQHRGYGNGGGAKHGHRSGPQPSQEAPGGNHHGTETGNQVIEAFGRCHGARLAILCGFVTG